MKCRKCPAEESPGCGDQLCSACRAIVPRPRALPTVAKVVGMRCHRCGIAETDPEVWLDWHKIENARFCFRCFPVELPALPPEPRVGKPVAEVARVFIPFQPPAAKPQAKHKKEDYSQKRQCYLCPAIAEAGEWKRWRLVAGQRICFVCALKPKRKDQSLVRSAS